MAKKVLVVDDEKLIVKGIRFSLEQDGMEVDCAYDGEEALKMATENAYDMILLDIMLPKRTGLEVLKELRQISNIPILMLTALDDEPTQAASFDEQADDYITKPFSMLLLGKRVTALLRRCGKSPELKQIQMGDITVDFGGYTASGPGGPIDLTPKEIDLLKLLIEHKGLVLTRSQILDELWGYDYPIIDRTIDTYIKNLRKKLSLDRIVTVKGVGYKYEEHL